MQEKFGILPIEQVPVSIIGDNQLCPPSTGTRSDHVVIFLPTTAQRIIRIPAFPGFGIESCQHSAAKTSSLLRITNSLPAPRQPYPGAWQKPHPAKWIAAPGHPACREINMFNNVPPLRFRFRNPRQNQILHWKYVSAHWAVCHEILLRIGCQNSLFNPAWKSLLIFHLWRISSQDTFQNGRQNTGGVTYDISETCRSKKSPPHF